MIDLSVIIALEDTDIPRRIKKWNKNRGLLSSLDVKTEESLIKEELIELINAKDLYDRIDAFCDIVVVYYGTLFKAKNSVYGEIINDYVLADIIDRLIKFDIVSFFIRNNLDFVYCMDECLKHIESRKGAINKDTGKWEKIDSDVYQPRYLTMFKSNI